MKIKDVITNEIKKLESYNIEDASIKVRMILAYVLKCRKDDLILHYEEEMTVDDEKLFLNYISRIENKYPLQYITHTQEFMKLDFFVNEDVLIPRCDTEILVEEASKIIEEEGKRDILELCTGSGAISISLLKYIKNVNITATDISKKALTVAKKNEKNILRR